MDTPHSFIDYKDSFNPQPGWVSELLKVEEEDRRRASLDNDLSKTSSLEGPKSTGRRVSFANDHADRAAIDRDANLGATSNLTAVNDPDMLRVAVATSNQSGSVDCSLIMDKSERRKLSDAFIKDTLESLPVKPEKVSNVQGPFVQVRPIDNTSVDVQVSHQFRAHFGSDGAIEASPSGSSFKIEEVDDDSLPVSRKTSLATSAAGPHSGQSLPNSGPHTHSGNSLSDQENKAFDLSLATLPDINQTTRRAPSQPEPEELRASEWEIDPTEVIIGERLAVGGFAEVFIGKYQGTLVAVKLLLNVDDLGRHRFKREVALLASLRHPNLILFMGYATQPHLAIVSEYMHRGSLFKVLRKGGDKPLEPRLQKSVAISVARGMAYLHSRNILHLDLKSPNILIDDKWRVKVTDFGLSRVMHNTYMSAGAGAGTPEWMAPCVLRSEKHDEKADVYSFGVVLWECLTGQIPWENMHPMQVVGAVGFQGKSLELPTVGDQFLIQLCGRCMSSNPAERPLFPQIVQELENHYAPGQYTSMSHTLSQSSARLGSASTVNRRATEQGMARSIPAVNAAADDGVGVSNASQASSGARNLREKSAFNDASKTAAITSSSSSGSERLNALMAAGTIESDGPISTASAAEAAAFVAKQPLHTAKSLSNASPFSQLPAFGDEDGEDQDELTATAIMKSLDSTKEEEASTSRSHLEAPPSLATINLGSAAVPREFGRYGQEGGHASHDSLTAATPSAVRLSLNTVESLEVPSFTSSIEAAQWEAVKKAVENSKDTTNGSADNATYAVESTQ